MNFLKRRILFFYQLHQLAKNCKLCEQKKWDFLDCPSLQLTPPAGVDRSKAVQNEIKTVEEKLKTLGKNGRFGQISRTLQTLHAIWRCQDL